MFGHCSLPDSVDIIKNNPQQDLLTALVMSFLVASLVKKQVHSRAACVYKKEAGYILIPTFHTAQASQQTDNAPTKHTRLQEFLECLTMH